MSGAYVQRTGLYEYQVVPAADTADADGTTLADLVNPIAHRQPNQVVSRDAAFRHAHQIDRRNWVVTKTRHRRTMADLAARPKRTGVRSKKLNGA